MADGPITEIKLYRNNLNEVACKHCVPGSKTEKHRKEKWKRMTLDEIKTYRRKIGGVVTCNTCESTGQQLIGKRAKRHASD